MYNRGCGVLVIASIDIDSHARWPKSWQDAMRMLRKVGYKDPNRTTFSSTRVITAPGT